MAAPKREKRKDDEMHFKVLVDKKPIACRECFFLMDEGRYNTESEWNGYLCRIMDLPTKNIHNARPDWCPLRKGDISHAEE